LSPFWREGQLLFVGTSAHLSYHRGRTSLSTSDVNLEELFYSIAYCVRCSHNDVTKSLSQDSIPPVFNEGPLLELSSYSHKMLYGERLSHLNNRVITSMFTSNHSLQANEIIIRHMAWEDPQFTMVCVKHCSHYFQVNEHHSLYHITFASHIITQMEHQNTIFIALLNINDSFQFWRISLLLSHLDGFFFALSCCRSREKMAAMLTQLRKWANAIPLVVGFILAHKDELQTFFEKISTESTFVNSSVQKGDILKDHKEFLSSLLTNPATIGIEIVEFPDNFKKG